MHKLHDRYDFPAGFSKAVFYFRRYDRVHMPKDEVIVFEASPLLGDHFLRDIRQFFADVIEPEHAVTDVSQELKLYN